MRKFTFLAIFIMALLSFGLHFNSNAQLIFEENFDYPVGDLLTAHGWINHSGTSNFIATTVASITYPTYLSSGIGNEVTLLGTGEDVHQTFAAQTTGSVYASFIVNITTAVTDTGDYFFHLGQTELGSAFRGRVLVKKNASNNLAFGIRFASQTATPTAYTPFSYSLGTTYLLVVKYTFVEGTSNDVVCLFIDPVLGAAEPAPNVTALDINTDLTDIGTVSLRQGSTALAPTLKFDGIRVGLTWNDCVGVGTVVAPTIQASNLTFSNVLQTQMDLAWTNGDGAKRIAIINTDNYFGDPIDGTDPLANNHYNGTGQQIVYNNNGNSLTVDGLTGGTTYWFRVYEYNGTGTTTKFLSVTAPLNPNSQTTQTAAVLPIITNPTFASVTNASALLGGDITSDGGAPVLERGTVWNTTPGVTIGDNILAEGGTAVGVFAHTRDGLAPETQIFFKAYATNAVGTSLTTESAFFTLAIEPTSHVTGFTAAGSSITSIDLSWTTSAPGADGYLILQKTGATPPSGIPEDATGYSVGSVLGDGTVAALAEPGSVLLQTIAGLSPATQYSFTIIPYAWDGANFQTYNYYTAPVIPGATASTNEPPTVVYTWIGADNEAWTTPTNWNPTRSVPAPNDILWFNDGTWKTITSVPTETIRKLTLENNTTINLQSVAASTITISGGTDIDLSIPAGCAIYLNAAIPITLALGTGATGNIGGNMTFEAAAHRLTAADAGAITFNSGAIFTAGAAFAGNAFGQTSLGSIIFGNGSTYIHQSGSNPFGASQPGSVVVFQTGSLYKFISTGGTPSFSGRTYADFEMDAPGITIAPTGGGPVSIDNLTITSGTLNFNTTGTPGHSIKGNITVATDAILNFAPASAGTVTLNGTSQQAFAGAGTIMTSINSTIEIANSAGITLNSPVIMNGNLQFTNGLVTLGANNLFLGTECVISGTPSASAMIVATGTGKLLKGFAGPGSFTFPVGDNTGNAEYSPVTLTFASGTFALDNFASVNLVNAKYPNDPNTTNYLNRYWNIAQSGITEFSCIALFQYVTGDITGTEADISCVIVDPAPFNRLEPANTTLHQLTANWLTSFGTFTGTQLLLPTAITTPATNVADISATLNGQINANQVYTTVSFEYGWLPSYGEVITGVPSTVTGNTLINISADLTGLSLNTTYYYRIVGTSTAGTSYGEQMTFLTGCPLPSTPGPVSGPSTVCENGFGYVYSVDAVPGATFYIWTLPAGASIAFGAGTNQITVDFGTNAVSGNISVQGNNNCGNGPASPTFPVTVNPLPSDAGTITGPSSVCAGETGANYQVPLIPFATSYSWTIPFGATITSGATTNSIIVTFGPNPDQGVFKVYGINGCGNGAISSDFSVTINAIPDAPEVTAVGAVLTSSAPSGNQWYNNITGLIPGATGQTWTAILTATYWSVVTINNCASPESNHVYVIAIGQQELGISNFNVYPVPNKGLFTVALASQVQEVVTIQVFNQLGAKIYELKDVVVNGLVEKQIDLRPVAHGVYSVVILNKDRKVVRKLMVNGE